MQTDKAMGIRMSISAIMGKQRAPDQGMVGFKHSLIVSDLLHSSSEIPCTVPHSDLPTLPITPRAATHHPIKSSHSHTSLSNPPFSFSRTIARSPNGAIIPPYRKKINQSSSVSSSNSLESLTEVNFNSYPGSTTHSILLTISNNKIFICSTANPCPKHFLECALNAIK